MQIRRGMVWGQGTGERWVMAKRDGLGGKGYMVRGTVYGMGYRGRVYGIGYRCD